MSFSASSSFAAAAMLTGACLLSVLDVKKRSEYGIVSLPFGFAIQQIMEAVLWLTFGVPRYHTIFYTAAYSFLSFVLCIWPVWIPWAVWFNERPGIRKNILALICVAGLGMSGLGIYILLTYPCTIGITCRSVVYTIASDALRFKQFLYCISYFFVTISPFFVSNQRVLWIWGVVMVLSAIVTYYMWLSSFISVYCFFAALLTAFIGIWVTSEKE